MSKEEPKDRLRQARLQAGFATKVDATRRYGWSYSTYAAHENGQNDISREWALTYSRAYGVRSGWLLTGEGHKKDSIVVPIEGYVGAGFVVLPFEEQQQIEMVEVPAGWGNGLKCLRIRGDSMVPGFYDGDLVFYAPGTEVIPPAELVNYRKECVVRLRTGEMYLKRISNGARPGRFTLISYNADPILDVQIDWACPIKYIQRR